MKHEKLSEALSQISDSHIAEAAAPRRQVRLPWLGTAAAVLALVTLVTMLTRPLYARAEGLIAAPEYPQMVRFSEDNWEAWGDSQAEQYDQPRDYAVGSEKFFRDSILTFLTGSTENQVCSPMNIYMALAMLTEAADGESREELLRLLGCDSIDKLRAQAGHMWNAHYCDDGLSTSVLASSLWLNEGCAYREDTVNTLAGSYYASVYQGELGSNAMNTALRNWLNEQTGDLLADQTKDISMSVDTVLAIASTIYYNVQWSDQFNEVNNYDGVFHSAAGDVDVTYMYRVLSYGPYYKGDDFGAVNLGLWDGSRMWLILPDEGYAPADLLESSQAIDMILDAAAREDVPQKQLRVNVSLPKFDIVSDLDLIESLKVLGVTQVFDPDSADLSHLISQPKEDVFVSQISHAARVGVDEDGVLAAAYTVILADDAAALPPEEEIDFTLDRPFLFLIESSSGIPLFTGIVNHP